MNFFFFQNQNELDQEMILFSFDYPPNDGGIARMCFEISKELNKNIKQLSVLTEASKYIPDGLGIKIIPISGRRPILDFFAFFKILTSFRNKVIICSRWYPEGFLCFLAGAHKSIILAHGAEILPTPGRKGKILNHFKKQVLANASAVICNSDFTKKLVITTEPSANPIVIPLAVNEQEFFPVDTVDFKEKNALTDKFIITSVSRLQAHKGQDTVLRAIASLEERYKEEVIYLIAGKGEFRETLEKLISELEIEKNVRFIGFVEENELNALYSATDLFALCSKTLILERKIEGFGLVLLEAQACETAIVGTNSGGIPSAVNTERGGFLIEEDNVQQMAELIRELFDSPELIKSKGKEGRERVIENCTWEKYITILTQEIKKSTE
jgi:phosphatidylinositol alpha-1,6-mannosyltransferase